MTPESAVCERSRCESSEFVAILQIFLHGAGLFQHILRDILDAGNAEVGLDDAAFQIDAGADQVRMVYEVEPVADGSGLERQADLSVTEERVAMARWEFFVNTGPVFILEPVAVRSPPTM